jgi:hypothetical protein
MMRKWTALILSVALVATVSSTVMAAPAVPGAVYGDSQAAGVNKPVTQVQQELQQAGVTDVKPTDYFAGSVTVVLQAGLLAPDANGNFNPEKPVSGSEGIAVFAKVLGIASKNDSPEQAVAKAKEAGLVSGEVKDEMTRLEVAKLLAKALGVEPAETESLANYPWKDLGAVGNTSDAAILVSLYRLGIFKGYDDGTFKPGNVLTRAEIAILVDRVLGAYAK